MDLKEQWQRKKRGYEIMAALRARDLRGMTHEQWMHSIKVVWSVREPDQKYFQTALWLQRKLFAADIDFCFIGGLALQRWGEARQTQDIDLTIFCPLGEERRVTDTLSAILESREEDVEGFATIARMFLGVAPDGIRVDASLGFMPYEKRVMERAIDVNFEVADPLHCCSPEDLAILKTVAGRDQDWADIRRIVQRSGARIDWELVYKEVKVLLALSENPEHEERLREIVRVESQGITGTTAVR
jgi:Nucleotidyl transferase AbiEii toxin, Type IV TA system